MKIDPTQVEQAARAQAAASAANSREGTRAPKSPVSEDHSEISSIGSLASKIGSASDERIEELRKQVNAGNYSVSASQLSKKIVDSLLPD